MALVNIDKLYLALIHEDSKGLESFDAPEYIEGVQSFDAKNKLDTAYQYEEGVLAEQDTVLQNVDITFNLGHISNTQYAKYLGHHVASQGGVYSLDSDVAPYIAVLYQYEKSNHKKGWKVYYKGKLAEPDDSVKQREGKTDYQNHQVTATFQPLKRNKLWKYTIEEDDPNCPADIATKFFQSVIIPDEDSVPPTATTLPLDAATGVASNSNVVFTFDKALDESSVNSSNILLMKADGTLVASALTLDDTKKIVTLNPVTDLSTGQYVAVCSKNVKSISNVQLNSAIIVNFTV